MHTHPTIIENGKRKIMSFYNETKGGVDTFKQMCSYYAVGCKTKRWPIYVFYGMINGSVINSWITHSKNQLRIDDSTVPWHKSMQKLAVVLIRPWAEKKLVNASKMSHNLKQVISTVCSIPLLATTAPPGYIMINDSRVP